MEYVRFLYIAYGSVCELETQAMISGELGYVKKTEASGIKRANRGCRDNAQSVDQISGKQTIDSLNP